MDPTKRKKEMDLEFTTIVTDYQEMYKTMILLETAMKQKLNEIIKFKDNLESIMGLRK